MELFLNMPDGWRFFCCVAVFVVSLLGANLSKKMSIKTQRPWWIAVGATGAMIVNWISHVIFNTELYW